MKKMLKLLFVIVLVMAFAGSSTFTSLAGNVGCVSANSDCIEVWWKCVTDGNGDRQCWDETFKIPDMMPYNPVQ